MRWTKICSCEGEKLCIVLTLGVFWSFLRNLAVYFFSAEKNLISASSVPHHRPVAKNNRHKLLNSQSSLLGVGREGSMCNCFLTHVCTVHTQHKLNTDTLLPIPPQVSFPLIPVSPFSLPYSQQDHGRIHDLKPASVATSTSTGRILLPPQRSLFFFFSSPWSGSHFVSFSHYCLLSGSCTPPSGISVMGFVIRRAD